MTDPTYIAAYDSDRHTVHVREAHFGPRPGFDGDVLASQLNKLSNCMALGIHVTVEIQFRIVLRDVVDLTRVSTESNRYLCDRAYHVPAIEEALATHPDIDALLMGADTIQAFVGMNALMNLQYRGPNGRLCRLLSWDKCGPNEIWFVSWKLEEAQ